MLWARRVAIGLFLLVVAASHFLYSFAPRFIVGEVDDGAKWHHVPTYMRGVSVGWQGRRLRTLTDERGRFRLPAEAYGRRLVATKPGLLITSSSDPSIPLKLKLEPTGDASSYQWTDPHRDPEKPENCANCHREIYSEWSASAHGRSATNHKFLSMYAGSDKPWNAPFENIWGVAVCVTCHVPTFSALAQPELPFDGVHKSGIHCDLCHKVSDVPTGKFGTRFGRDALELLRPAEGDRLTFGPLDDAVRKGESFAYRPVYKESRYCASCHEGVVFGVHAYGTYSEWLESPAKAQGKQCQTCHMAPTGMMTNIAPGKGGIERDPFTLASHHTPGGQFGMLKKAISMTMTSKPDPGGRRVEVEINAQNVGHRVPTGFPDRQLILVVTASDKDGKPVDCVEGQRLPRSAGRLSGQAGSLFAKQLHGETGRTPIPYWLHVDKVVDTRLMPERPERREFLFPPTASRVEAKIWYRRFWQEVADQRGWTDNDVLVVEHQMKFADVQRTAN